MSVRYRAIGQEVRRPEDPRLLAGGGTYVGEVVLPGMLHMAVLRSPHAHANVGSIDTAAARALPGVHAVITPADVRGIGEFPVLFQPPGQRHTGYPVLPHDRVRYAGQPVAVAVAQHRYAAEDALDRIAVEYELIPAVTDVDQAMDPNAPRLYETWPDNVVAAREIRTGDPDAGFSSAHVVVEGEFTLPRQTAAPLGGRNAVARHDRFSGELTLWVSNQAPHHTGPFSRPCSFSTRVGFA